MRTRATFFISAIVAVHRSALAFARGNSKLSPFTHSLTHLPTAGRVRAFWPYIYGSTSPPLPFLLSVSAVSKSARSGDAVWKVISVLPLPFLTLSLSYLN